MATAKAKTYTVDTTVYGVSLREEPEGRILEKVLPNGTKVNAVSEADGWVEVDGGWIRSKYLK